MPRPGPNVTSDADTQPGSDSLFPTGFSGGGALVRQGSVGTGELADGSVAAADLNLASVATALAARSEFTTTYGRLTADRPGSLGVALGDSLTQASTDNTNMAIGESWFAYACAMTGQRLQFIRNSGISGNTTAQMLARFDTDVTAYAPNVVALLAGTNDSATDFTTWTTTYQAIVAKIRAIGAVPVVGTIPPNSTGVPSDRPATVRRMNNWIRRYAAAQGITLLDFFSVLADPVTGNYKSAYNTDGTHPNSAGYAAMGSYAATVLAPLLPTGTPPLCMDDTDELNIILSGTFASATGTSLPTGWGDNAGNSGSAISYTTDSAVPGKLFTLTQTAASLRQIQRTMRIGSTTLSADVAAGATSITIPVRADTTPTLHIGDPASPTYEIVKASATTGAGPQTLTVRALRYAHTAGEQVVFNAVPGDTLVYSGLVTSDGGVGVSARIATSGGTPGTIQAMNGWPAALTRAVWQYRFVVPASSTQVSAQLQTAAGTGVVSFGQVGIYNATRGGF